MKKYILYISLTTHLPNMYHGTLSYTYEFIYILGTYHIKKSLDKCAMYNYLPK